MTDILINPIVLDVYGLKCTEIALYVAIARFVNRETGLAWPGQTRLARTAGMAERTVRRVLPELVAKGLIEILPVIDGRSNQYRLLPINRTERPLSPEIPDRESAINIEDRESAIEIPDRESAIYGTESPLSSKIEDTVSAISKVADRESAEQQTVAVDLNRDPDLSISNSNNARANPALDDDPPAPPDWSEHETAIIRAECDRIGFNGLGLESLRARGPETALALLYHVQQSHVANPAGLLVTMLRSGGLPAEKHLKRAEYVLGDDPDGDTEQEEPEGRGDSAEHAPPDLPDTPAREITLTATGEPERGPEPAAPVGDGLEDRLPSGRTVYEVWVSTKGQAAVTMPERFFKECFDGCGITGYANGVLTVRPSCPGAQRGAEKMTFWLEDTLKRFAGTALRVQWFWPAHAGAGIEVADKLAAK